MLRSCCEGRERGHVDFFTGWVCGLQTELEFWGVEEDEIEECCWTNYNAWTRTLLALRRLEQDRRVNMPGSQDGWQEHMNRSHSKLRELQMKSWAILHNPRSSIPANIYGYVSLTFVLVSIFSFVAQTHEYFRVPSHNKTAGNIASAAAWPSALNTSADNVTASTTSWTRHNGSTARAVSEAHPVLLGLDAACLFFFLAELACRVLLSPNKLKLFAMPMTVIDLLALLPDVIEFSIRVFRPEKGNSAVDVITFMRLLRTFRIFRLMRHFPGLWILFYTLKASVKELLLLLMFVFVGMIFFASLIHYADDQKVFTSIPAACWWAVITMTTVGYGDMYPTTKWGYAVGTMTAICGVLVVGFTVPVLVNNFILYYQHTQCAFSRERANKRRAELKQQRQRFLEKHAQARAHEQVSATTMKMTVLQAMQPQSRHSANGKPGRSASDACKTSRKPRTAADEKIGDGVALLDTDDAETSLRQRGEITGSTSQLSTLV